MDQIIFCKFSSFSIRDIAFQSTFPMPQALKPNTFDNSSKINLTKAGFRNGGHYSTIVTSLSHSHYALAWAQLATFWLFCFCTAMAFLKLRAFILTWSWCRRPLSECYNPTLRECDDETHIFKIRTWESFGTPETLKFDIKGQNASHWSVPYIIGKLSKCKCRKWARMGHLDIYNPSYGKKKGRESNWQFDS